MSISKAPVWHINYLDAQVSDLKGYTNPNYGIEIQFPSNWTVDEQDYNPDDLIADVAYFVSPLENDSDKYGEQLAVRIEDLGVLNLSLDKYLDDTINAYSSLENFKVLDSDSRNTFLAGNPAYRFTYTFTEKLDDENDDNGGADVSVKAMEIATIVGKKGYYVDYYADAEKFDTYLPMIQKMIDSLTIDKSITPNQQGGLGGGNIIESGSSQQQDQQLQYPGEFNQPPQDQGNTAPPPDTIQLRNFLEYSNPNLGFKINYPAGSSVQEYPNGAVFGIDGGGNLAVSISVISDVNMQLNEFTDLTINQLRQDFQGFHVIVSDDVTLAGHPARLLIYDYNDDGTLFRVAGHWAIVNNVAYKIMVITVPPLSDNLADIAIDMVGSLRIIQEARPQQQGPGEFNQPQIG